MNFKISDKVVCVDNSAPKVDWDNVVTKGRVYVIRAAWLSSLGKPLVLTVGDSDALNFHGLPMGWAASRFRLLSDVQAENRERAIFEKMQKAFDSAPPASGCYGLPINPGIPPNLGDWMKWKNP